jgi:hypothetical protein
MFKLKFNNKKDISNKEKFIKNPIQFVLKNRFYLKYPYIIPLFPFEDNIIKLNQTKFNINKLLDEIDLIENNNNKWISKGKTNIWDSLTIKSKYGEEQPYLEEVDYNGIYKYTESGEKCNYIKEILDSLDTDIYLVRLLKLAPHSKVSWHTDELVFKNINKIIRCHIPIKTNKDCKMLIGHPLKEPEINNNNIWQAETLFEEHLEEGFIYYTNVNSLHSVYNSSDIERIHLVIDLKPTEKMLQLILK